MNDLEVGQLLARIQVLDNRSLDQATHMAWSEIVGDLRYDDTVRAVNEHYASSGDYLMPHHIVTLARKYQDERDREARKLVERGEATGVPKPPWMEEATVAANAAFNAALAAGHSRGSRTARQSQLDAGSAVQDAWEAEHGQWRTVWPQWHRDHPEAGRPNWNHEEDVPW